MKTTEKEILELDPSRVKIFIHRERASGRFALIKESIATRGQKIPGSVRDIRHWPRSDRERPEGGLYEYGLIFGQGRLLIARELGRKFRATLDDQTEAAVCGDFLAENLARTPLSWWDMALIVKVDIDSGMSADEVAKEYAITVGHVQKLHRTVSKTPTELEDKVAAMSMNDAEVFTALPADHQTIVMDVFHETGEKDLKAIIRKAKRITEDQGVLSPMALKASISRVGEDLKRVRENLKLARLHHSIGPANLSLLLQDRKFKTAIQKAGVNLAKISLETA